MNNIKGIYWSEPSAKKSNDNNCSSTSRRSSHREDILKFADIAEKEDLLKTPPTAYCGYWRQSAGKGTKRDPEFVRQRPDSTTCEPDDTPLDVDWIERMNYTNCTSNP